MAVLAPSPRDRARTAARVKPGRRASPRRPYRRSLSNVRIAPSFEVDVERGRSAYLTASLSRRSPVAALRVCSNQSQIVPAAVHFSAEGGRGCTLFCPNCLLEFEEGLTRCGECDVELVDAIEEEGELEFQPLLEVTEAGFFGHVTECLEEAGIAWFVQSEESLGLLPRDERAGPGRPGDNVATIYVEKAGWRRPGGCAAWLRRSRPVNPAGRSPAPGRD